MTSAYDRAMAHEAYVHEVACVECGYHRKGAAHPKVKCPKSGRCGLCGNEWPCEDHTKYVIKLHPVHGSGYLGGRSSKDGEYVTGVLRRDAIELTKKRADELLRAYKGKRQEL